MNTAVVRFPVICPVCGGEGLTIFPVADLGAALLTGNEVILHSPCHDRTWTASGLEVEQIREYLGALVA